MSSKSGFRRLMKVVCVGTVVAAAVALNAAVATAAANYYWSFSNSGATSPAAWGAADWSLSDTTWINTSWVEGNSVIFEGATGGSVTLGQGAGPNYVRFKTDGYSIDNTSGNNGQAVLDINNAGGSIIDTPMSGTATISVILDNNGGPGVTKTGSGKLVLSGNYANTYTGPFTVSAGSVHLDKSSGVAITGNVNLTGGNGTKWADDSLALDASDQIATSSVISFNPGSTVNAQFNLNSHSQTVAGISDTTGNGVIANAISGVSGNGTLTVANSSNCSFNGSIGNYGSGSTASTLALVKDGSATLTLGGAGGANYFTYQGGLTVQGSGTLKMGCTSALGGYYNAIAVNSGAIDVNGYVPTPIGATTYLNDLTINGTGVSNTGALVNSSATAVDMSTSFNHVVLGSDATIGATGNLTVNTIIGHHALTKVGAGTLVAWGGNNDITDLTVAAGTLQLTPGHQSGLGGGAALVESGASVDGNGTEIDSKAITINGTGVSSMGALLNSSDTAAGSSTFSIALGSDSSIGVTGAGSLMIGTVSGGHALTKVGAGTLIMAGGNNSHTDLTIAAGTIQFTPGYDSEWGSGNAVVQSGATADVNGMTLSAAKTVTVNGAGVGGIGAFINSSATDVINSNFQLTLGSDSSIGVTGAGNLILGSISGNHALTKVGSGTGSLVLDGADTYTGATTVSAGALIFGSTGSALMDIKPTGAPSEQFLGTGTLALDGTLKLDLSAITGSSGSWMLVDMAHLAATYDVGTFAVTLADGTPFTLNPSTSVWTYTVGAKAWSFSESTGMLTLGAVPEPGTIVLLATGFVGLLAYAWRKRK